MKLNKLSVIIPIYNEAKNIEDLILRLKKAFLRKKHYELIFVDDNSTDETDLIFEKLRTNEKIIFLKKKGKKGKAFSILEGFEAVSGNIVAVIDGDLQYPPEAIPQMIMELENADIIVANRKEYKDTFLRKILSSSFRTFFGRFLFGLSHDVQAGLKIMTREVIETIKFKPGSAWTFDLEFLHRSREAGFRIKNFDITFSARKNGSSKITIGKQIFEIGINAFNLKLKKIHPVHIHPKDKNSMLGAGVGFNKKKYITHTILHYKETALKTFTLAQKIIFLLLTINFIIAFIIFPLQTLQVFVALLSLIYFIDVLFNFFLISKSLRFPQEITTEEKEIAKLDDKNLPIYTVLCPLYRELHVLPQFLSAIEKISWPKKKLDVILLLEEDDIHTIEGIKKMEIPSYVRRLIVPHSMPKTKPKACNYGLAHAKGEYLVIFDAEDIPDPMQLKKAYIAFGKVSEKVICLQAKLNYYNPHQNLLTRFFTAEYSLWFDVTLTGLQSINTSIPLGGTSNHFRIDGLKEIKGWDVFNVTEDADLGLRLFKKGYQTAIIDSITLEEANSKVKNWIRQRSRWIKGYMQTYLVHTRQSMKFQGKKAGLHSLIFQLVIGGKIAFILINPILWFATFAYFALYSHFGLMIEKLYPTWVFYMAAFSFIFGNFLFLYYYMIGVAKKEQWSLMKYVYLIPIYWFMISIAALLALYQLVFKPHYWEKTVHGFHLQAEKIESEVKAEVVKVEKEIKVINPWRFAFPRLEIEFSGLKQTWESFVISFLKMRQARNAYVLGKIKDLKNLPFELKSNEIKEGKINILIFNWRDTKHKWAGGAEVYIHELAKRWVKDGNNVTLFCGNSMKQARVAKIDGVEIIRTGGFFTVYVFAFLYYILKFRGKYDIIIDCENGIPFFTPLYSRKPIFLLIHHVHQEVFRKSLPLPFALFASFLETKLMPFVYRNIQVITVSSSSRQEILRHKLTKTEPVIIHNGVDLERFKPGIKSKKPLILYVGRLQFYKSLDIFINAAKKILEKIPDVEFIIAGEGEYRIKLQKYAEKLGLKEKIKFTGKVTEEEKVELFQKAWIFVNPSLMEGWGITTIEANACRTPAVASDVPGLRDSIKNPHTGFLVPYAHIDGFAEKITKLIKNKKLRKEFSDEALKWANNFTWEKSAADFYSLVVNKVGVKEEKVEKQFPTAKFSFLINKLTSLF